MECSKRPGDPARETAGTALRRLRTSLAAALTMIGLALGAPAAAQTPTPEAVAERAYLYGLQQAIFYGQRWIYP